MKVFIFSDLEGISGVCRFVQTGEDGPRYEDARRLLMGDINACVDGLLDAGVDQVVVRDGHGKPYNLVAEMMHPKATHIVGGWYGRPLGGLEPDCDAVILLGHHAMAGTPKAVLCHTQSLRGDRYFYNGRETGEIGQEAMIAGHFDIPVIMISGDDAACREAREFLGDGPVVISVKKALAREGAELLAPEVARQKIRAGAAEAVARLPQCKPYKVESPVHIRLEFPDKETADNFRSEHGARAADTAYELTVDQACDIFQLC